MQCENCEQEHDGKYGSGRFCNGKCARGFSTKAKRKEINEKVSKSLTGRPAWSSGAWQKGEDSRRFVFNEEAQKKSQETQRINREILYASLPFHELPGSMRKNQVLEEQNGKCSCGLGSEWNGKPITLELHHIDGNPKNNKKENLSILCPNCHSQTDNFRFNKRTEEIINER